MWRVLPCYEPLPTYFFRLVEDCKHDARYDLQLDIQLGSQAGDKALFEARQYRIVCGSIA